MVLVLVTWGWGNFDASLSDVICPWMPSIISPCSEMKGSLFCPFWEILQCPKVKNCLDFYWMLPNSICNFRVLAPTTGNLSSPIFSLIIWYFYMGRLPGWNFPFPEICQFFNIKATILVHARILQRSGPCLRHSDDTSKAWHSCSKKPRETFLWQSAGPPCYEGTSVLPLAASTRWVTPDHKDPCGIFHF